jgi:hypothetical protein
MGKGVVRVEEIAISKFKVICLAVLERVREAKNRRSPGWR